MSVHPLELDEIKTIYSEDDLTIIDLDKVPKHIAIIMDGNRRWAARQGCMPIMGHWEGAETLMEIVRSASELGVKTLTVYAFSTENWQRSESEIADLMKIFELYLVEKRAFMLKEGVRLDAIGDLSKMPDCVVQAFKATKKATERGEKINLVLAFNYGGRDEIRRAVTKMLKDGISADEVTEEEIAKRLDTSPFGDPQLLIRTSGEMRVSNFLLWQICYAEIFSTEVLWPDFSPKELLKAIGVYQNRQRRLGK